VSRLSKEVDHIIGAAEQQCKTSGARLTNKRKQVLAGLVQADKALSAYELIDYCKAEYGESLPAMSVYRILDFLHEERLVHKLDLANKYVACSHITCDHAHAVPQFLICSQCQVVKEVNIDQSTIDQLKLNVESAGYHLSGFQLEMNCICEACALKQASSTQ